MSWAAALPALALAVVLLMGPGLLWGAAAGLRGLTLLAVASPLGLTATVVAAELAAAAGIRWSVLPLGALTMLGTLALWGARRRWAPGQGRPATRDPHAASTGVLSVAWTVSAVPLAVILLWIFQAPENIAQSHDNILHLNAIRYIADTGNASSLTLGYLGAASSGTFYPAGWHAVVSLLMINGGLPVAAAINVGNLVLITTIWSTGCLFLVSRLHGEQRIPLLAAAVLSTAFGTFPYLLLEFGVVYPFLLSVALLPVLLGLVVQFSGLGAPTTLGRTGTAALLLALLPGAVLAHPSVLAGLAGMGAPVLATAVLQQKWTRPRTAGALILLAGVLAGIWAYARPSRAGSMNWDDWGNPIDAVLEILLQAPVSGVPAVLVLICVGAGLVSLARHRRHRWVIGPYLVGAGLFVAGNLRDLPELRWILTGVWYNDYFRISALFPVGTLLLASVGAVAIARRVPSRTPVAGTAAAAVVVGLAVAPLYAAGSAINAAAAKYRFTATSQLLTIDERELLARLPDHVPEGSGIVGNPLTGASLSYAYTGRPTLLPYGTSSPTADGALILENLDSLRTDPAVCEAVEATGIEYVLDFGSDSVHPGERSIFPGLRELTPANGFDLVDQEGSARLLRITGCG